jgi:hypothetical protein
MNQTISQSKNLRAVRNGGLEHAFDFDLQASPDKEPYVSNMNRVGAFIVNAVGTVRGEMIQGKIKMSFFALDCAYLLVQAGVDPGPGRHLCKESDGGVIETEDGARITFDTRGYGLRGADLSFPKRWRLGMGVQFSTTDKRYEWLNTTFGFWEGQFDEEKGTASYKGYVRRYD